MSTQFYITLPSNSLSSNSAAEFITSLPVNINLDGEWEVGLSEIIYGNTWFNITSNNDKITFFDDKHELNVTLHIAKGRYEDVHGLMETIVNTLESESKRLDIEFQRSLGIAYNHYIKKCQISINTDVIYNLQIPADVAYMLGFSQAQLNALDNNSGRKNVYAHHPVDMSCSLNHLYVYCNILKPQIVGNALVPLLQIVSVEGHYVDTVCRTYITPHYIPILKNSFAQIEISIRDDQNRPIKFEYGKTIVKLHFRKIY